MKALTSVILLSILISNACAADGVSARQARSIANRAITLRAPEFRGMPGPQGPPGPAAVQHYALINSAGGVEPAYSRGIAQANVYSPQIGIYCLWGLPPVKGAQVTKAAFSGEVYAVPSVSTAFRAFACAPGTQVTVLMVDYFTGTLTDSGFSVAVY